MGDLLVYGLFVTAAYKAFDRRGAIWAFAAICVFGALAPSVAPLVVSHFDQGANGIVIPAQLFFGPAAFAVTARLHRRHRERITSEWVRQQSGMTAPQGSSSPAVTAAVIRPVERPVAAGR